VDYSGSICVLAGPSRITSANIGRNSCRGIRKLVQFVSPPGLGLASAAAPGRWRRLRFAPEHFLFEKMVCRERAKLRVGVRWPSAWWGGLRVRSAEWRSAESTSPLVLLLPAAGRMRCGDWPVAMGAFELFGVSGPTLRRQNGFAGRNLGPKRARSFGVPAGLEYRSASLPLLWAEASSPLPSPAPSL